MAIQYYIDGQLKEINELYYVQNGVVNSLGSLFECKDSEIKTLWEAGNLRTLDNYIFMSKDNFTINTKE